MKKMIVLAAATFACGETGELRIDSVPSGLLPAQQQIDPSGELAIERARIAVSEIELEGGKEDEREAEMGDAIIEVVLSGEPTNVAVDAVEAGSYHTIGIELKVDSFDGNKASIVVEGTYRGSEFVFRSSIKPEVEFRLTPEVDVPAKGSATAGMSFDVGAWFKDGVGNVLDPTDANNQKTIEESIMRSMAVNAEIEDEDEDDD